MPSKGLNRESRIRVPHFGRVSQAKDNRSRFWACLIKGSWHEDMVASVGALQNESWNVVLRGRCLKRKQTIEYVWRLK